jgi:hypothetical protein
MRTAEERVSTALGGNLNISTLKLDFWYEIIREAQIEAIKECAEAAKLVSTPCGEIHVCGCEVCQYPIFIVNKQSILKLIDQVK